MTGAKLALGVAFMTSVVAAASSSVSSESTRTTWTIIGIVVAALLAVFWRAVVAGLGKFVLYLLKKEKDALRAFLVNDVLAERTAAINEVKKLAEAHEDALQQVKFSVEAHGTELAKVKSHTEGVGAMGDAIDRLASSQEKIAESLETLSLAFARMEEREKMREKWDGQTERRQRNRRSE